jgi:eukaryotic-like serine/threonine-protein kinase
MTTDYTGTKVNDRYALVELIASGGMGEVWRATDQVLGRNVAVKVLRHEFGQNQVTQERFRFEAQAAASLDSSNIASVFDYGEELGGPGGRRAYIVMELVNGESLDLRVRRAGALGVPEALDIIGQAALGLQAAHDRGLVHRDIKPANLLVRTDGVVKLTDFGIARALDASALTQTGTMVGTVQYMAPEQLSGRPATPASDIYALGIVAYFCVAGRAPFEYEESMAVALAHVHDRVPPLSAGVPSDVRDLVSRMLDKDPARRPPSAGAVASEAFALKNGFTSAKLVGASAGRPRSVPIRDAAMTTTPVTRPPGPAVTAAAPTQIDRRQTAVLSGALPLATDRASPGSPGRRRRGLLSAVLVLLAVIAVAAWLLAGPGSVTVPHLDGLAARTAAADLTHLGLHADQHFVDTSQPAGRVISQVPKAGTSVRAGSTVLLRSASGFVDVNPAPLQGMPAAQAVAALSSLGVQPAQRSAVSTAPPGSVISISPSGRVRLGTAIIVEVAVAPPPPTTQPVPPDGPAPPGDKKTTKGHGH